MNWKSHAPTTWKIATLKSLVNRAFLISSTKQALEKELNHIGKVFCDNNDYPSRLIDEIIKNERRRRQQNQENTKIQENNDNTAEEEKTTHRLNLPYAGGKGEQIIKKLQKYVKNTVNTEAKKIRVCSVYKAKKLATKFNIKDRTKFQDMHNIVYHVQCPNKKCKSHYTGQTKCRLEKRSSQHRSADKNSHVLKHTKKTKHKRVQTNNFKIIGKGYRSDFTRKISESLFIKKLKPNLNKQKDSYKLSLFN